jgi:hypothetical protein
MKKQPGMGKMFSIFCSNPTKKRVVAYLRRQFLRTLRREATCSAHPPQRLRDA